MAARPEAVAFAEKHNAKVRAERDTPGVGHNSAPPVKSYFDRRLALEKEKATVGEDIRELNAEMKKHDIDPRALAVLVKRELEDAEKAAKRKALEDQVDSYAAALGMLL